MVHSGSSGTSGLQVHRVIRNFRVLWYIWFIGLQDQVALQAHQVLQAHSGTSGSSGTFRIKGGTSGDSLFAQTGSFFCYYQMILEITGSLTVITDVTASGL